MRGRPAALAALFLVAVAFRPQIVGAGPLFPAIRDDLHASHAIVGLLGTIPVLCMGLLAPPAAHLVQRLGTRRAIAIAVASIGVFGLVRAGVPGIALVILATWPVGVGMGLGGAIAPVAVKERFPDRPGFATGVYATGIQVGSAVSSSVAVPIAHALGGWRWSLAIFSACSCTFVAPWLLALRDEPAHAPHPQAPPRAPWRRWSSWLLVGIFALMASSYYGLNNWLADSFVERGWSDSRAGLLLAVLNIAAIPGSLTIPWLSDHVGGRRPWLVLTAGVYCVGVLGFVLWPGGAWFSSAAVGTASGALFALVMTLPLDIEHDSRTVGALVGMMLGLGYTIGALSPFGLGAVRDATGSFTSSLWLVAAFCAALVVAVAAVPASHRRDRSPSLR